MTFYLWATKRGQQVMKAKTDVRQGTLALMVLKTLDVLGPLHGYGIARRIEQISGNLLAVNQCTLYPVLLKLVQEGAIASAWGASQNNRKARFYRLTRQGASDSSPRLGVGNKPRKSSAGSLQ
jgi:PadR family transcriptional regulator, regulatory protein PadR